MRIYQKIYSLGIVAILFLGMLSSSAQKNIIHGKVTLYQEIPVENATVSIKKTKNTVLTDSLGFFSLECKLKDKLFISVPGLSKKTIKIKSLTDSLNIVLTVTGDESDIGLAANNGYFDKRYVDLATKHYNTKPPYSQGYTNILELMDGKFPEITYVDNMFIMRGINSISDGSIQGNGALIVINGILSDIGSLKSISIIEITNIKILTGSQATRFGPGGANGVISVEMKSF